MTALEKYARSVERMERAPPRGVMRAALIKRLVKAIRTAPWPGEEERSQAQVLVYRLERLRLLGAGAEARPVEAPGPS